MFPKVCSADHKWSANLNSSSYFVVRGALKYFWWSAYRKRLGTPELDFNEFSLNLKKPNNSNWRQRKHTKRNSYTSLCPSNLSILVFGLEQNSVNDQYVSCSQKWQYKPGVFKRQNSLRDTVCRKKAFEGNKLLQNLSN